MVKLREMESIRYGKIKVCKKKEKEEEQTGGREGRD